MRISVRVAFASAGVGLVFAGTAAVSTGCGAASAVPQQIVVPSTVPSLPSPIDQPSIGLSPRDFGWQNVSPSPLQAAGAR
jgi:hypothetical protein